jgi:hypothetical protein
MRGPRAFRTRRGTSAIEFALTMTFVLIPLIAAVIEWSWYFYQDIRVMRVARDAARVGVSDTVVDGNRADVASDWAQIRLGDDMGFDISGGAVNVTDGEETISVGGDSRPLLRVELSVPYEHVIGLLPDGVDPPDHLNATFEMVDP